MAEYSQELFAAEHDPEKAANQVEEPPLQEKVEAIASSPDITPTLHEFRYTLGQLLMALESSDRAYQTNMRTVERQERECPIDADRWRIQTAAHVFQPHPRQMPGIDRMTLYCDRHYNGTGLTTANVRRLRAEVCAKTHGTTSFADELSLTEAMDILEDIQRVPMSWWTQERQSDLINQPMTVIDQLVLSSSQRLEICWASCLIVQGQQASVCPNADPPLPAMYLPQIVRAFKRFPRHCPEGFTVHWIGAKTWPHNRCQCYPTRQLIGPEVASGTPLKPSARDQGMQCPKCHGLLKPEDADRWCEKCRLPDGKLVAIKIALRTNPQSLARIPEWPHIQHFACKLFKLEALTKDNIERLYAWLQAEHEMTRNQAAGLPLPELLGLLRTAVDELGRRLKHKEEVTEGTGGQILSQRQMNILEAMLNFGAISSDARRTTDEIGREAEGRAEDYSAFKEPMTQLKKFGFIATRPGRGGGAWLTQLGIDRATSLQTQKVRKQ